MITVEEEEKEKKEKKSGKYSIETSQTFFFATTTLN